MQMPSARFSKQQRKKLSSLAKSLSGSKEIQAEFDGSSDWSSGLKLFWSGFAVPNSN